MEKATVFSPSVRKGERSRRGITQKYAVSEQHVKLNVPGAGRVWPPHSPFPRYILLCSLLYAPPKTSHSVWNTMHFKSCDLFLVN